MNRNRNNAYQREFPWWGLVGAVIALGLIGGGIWWYFGYMQDSTSRMWQGFTVEFVSRQFWPAGWNILHSAFWGFIALAIVLGLVAVIVGAIGKGKKWTTPVVSSLIVATLLIGIIGGFTSLWNNDKDGARSFAGSTTFVVSDITNLPTTLKPLAEGATVSDDVILSNHDVPGRIAEGDFDFTWEQRVASARGAEIVMSRTSGAVPNTYLISDSLSYVYGSNGREVWTAIRDGHNRTPVWGIVEWDGTGAPLTSCEFKGNNAINYAFDGRWGRSLADLIAHQHRELLYTSTDMWGYCTGATFQEDGTPNNDGTPHIVIPVVQQQSFGNRTTMRSAGVLVITGSPSGEPVIEHRDNLKAGDLPGPVYSSTLVDQQIGAIEWQAGRKYKNRLKFGFERTDVPSQASNNGNFLLRSKTDGRMYWVNPLTPRSSDSQQLTAFSLVPADQATTGELNAQRVYVANDNDTVANLNDLQARVEQAVRESDPGFFTGENAGSIVEFLPIDASTWQVYAELAGRVVYRIVIDSDARIQPVVYNIAGQQEEAGEATNGDAAADNGCSQPSQLSDADLARCISELSNELQKRLAAPQQQ